MNGYGLSSFPWPKSDRYKIGLALGCISFVLGGVLSLCTTSWIPIPAAVLVGFGVPLVLPPNPLRMMLSGMSEVAGVPFSGNFEFIAYNMAAIRHALKSDHIDRLPDEDTLLVACGVLDTMRHILAGHFTVEDVKDGLTSAKIGHCRLGLTTIPIRSEQAQLATVLGLDTDLFLDYTLQIEAMIFYAAECFLEPTGLSERDIILAVLDRRADIGKVLHTPTHIFAQSTMAASVRRTTSAFMDSPDFADLRREMGLE